MPLWDQVKGNLRELYTVAADKTEEMAKVNLRRYDRFGLSRELERRLTELGSLVYEGVEAGRTDLLQDPALLELVARIRRLEQDRQAKAEEIEQIRREHRQRAASRTQSRPAADEPPSSPPPPPAGPDSPPEQGSAT